MTPSRFLAMAKPPPPVLQACEKAVNERGVKDHLHAAMFDPANWHQSLTAPFYEQSAVEPLRRACARVRAPACTVALNRIRGNGSPPDIEHWPLQPVQQPSLFD